MLLSSFLTNIHSPFAFIRKGENPSCTFVSGPVSQLDRLDQIPRLTRKKKKGQVASSSHNESFHTLNIIPYAQIKERGYKVHDDGCKILSMKVEHQKEISMNDLILETAGTGYDLSLEGTITYSTSDHEYKQIIQKIITQEIGNGEGANFVIPRKGMGKIKDFSLEKALQIFISILNNEVGAYLTYLVYDGERYFIGASPEKHLSIQKGRVKMNPISGTFRKKDQYKTIAKFKQEFLSFLHDEKEINELFMVVDEELKMMAQICTQGGMIIGPLLKEMSKLIHTEYILAGNSQRDIIDILRDSLFAATVMGGPLENAANIIYQYESEGRRYYSGAIALIGTDEHGDEFLDSPIMIRSFEIDAKGNLQFQVGATLVRDSDPAYELEETKRKISGIISSITAPSQRPPQHLLDHLRNDEDIPEVLQMRNQHLSTFWFFQQADAGTHIPQLKGKKIIIIDNEDDFCFMQKHMFTRMGMQADVVRYSSFHFSDYQNYDLFVIGPGTGNPNDTTNPKMAKIHTITKQLFAHNKPFLSICLGHQVLCRVLGLKVKRKKETFQGVPKLIDFFGEPQIVGFYNTFAGFYTKTDAGKPISVSHDAQTGEVFALKHKEKKCISLQFHPESILTQGGYEVLVGVVLKLL